MNKLKQKVYEKKALTEREVEIIQYIVEEYSSKEIGQELNLSIETIKTHRQIIMIKLKVKNVAGLVREAFLKEIVPYAFYKNMQLNAVQVPIRGTSDPQRRILKNSA